MALGYVHEAWAEARLDGVDGDCMAQAAGSHPDRARLHYGEEAAAEFAAASQRASATADFPRTFAAISARNNFPRYCSARAPRQGFEESHRLALQAVTISPFHILFARYDRADRPPVTRIPS